MLGTLTASLGSLFQFENTHSKEMLPNTSEPPLKQLWGIASFSILQEEEISSSLFISPPQEAAERRRSALSLLFSKLKALRSSLQDIPFSASISLLPSVGCTHRPLQQNLTFVLNFHATYDGALFESIYIPLQGPVLLERVNSTSQFATSNITLILRQIL